MRIRALTVRIIRQFLKDRRTLALLLIAPLLLLTLMKFVLDSPPVSPKIGTVHLPREIAAALGQTGADMASYGDSGEAMEALRGGKLDAVLVAADAHAELVLEGSNPARSRAVLAVVQQAMQALNPAAGQLRPSIRYLRGNGGTDTFDYYGCVLVGFISFFFVFLVAGVSFLRERTTGTLQRLLATPLRRGEVVAGYLLGFGLFTIVQATLIIGFAIGVLGIALEGSVALVLLMNLLLALAALTLGTLLSAYAQNEFQMFQFIPLVVVPQIFFCGLVDLDAMPTWLRTIGNILPLYYGADALRGIMLRAAGWKDVWPDALALAGFSALFAGLNVLALRKHRRI